MSSSRHVARIFDRGLLASEASKLPEILTFKLGDKELLAVSTK